MPCTINISKDLLCKKHEGKIIEIGIYKYTIQKKANVSILWQHIRDIKEI